MLTTAPPSESTVRAGVQLIRRRIANARLAVISWPMPAKMSTTSNPNTGDPRPDVQVVVQRGGVVRTDRAAAEETGEGHDPDEEALPVATDAERHAGEQQDEVEGVHQPA